jgi:hypothetical protein
MTRPVEPGGTGPEEVTDDMLMALADGELPPATAMRLRNRLMDDPDLAARYAVYEATTADLRAAFAAGPVPDRLLSTVMKTPVGAPSDNVIALPRRRIRLAGMAMAASVVLALATGFLAGRVTDPAPGLAQRDAPAAEAALALASVATGGEVALASGGTARVLGSFQTDQGLCRMIALDLAEQEDRVIVCGAGTDWTVAMAIRTGDGRGFVTASDTVADLIDGYLDRIGASAPLTATEEAAALAP